MWYFSKLVCMICRRWCLPEITSCNIGIQGIINYLTWVLFEIFSISGAKTNSFRRHLSWIATQSVRAETLRLPATSRSLKFPDDRFSSATAGLLAGIKGCYWSPLSCLKLIPGFNLQFPWSENDDDRKLKLYFLLWPYIIRLI